MEKGEKFFSEKDPFFDGKRTFLDGKRTFFDETEEEKGSKIIEQQELVKTQKAERIGSFHIFVKIQEGDETKEGNRIKNGDFVKKGDIIGYLTSLGIEDKIYAEVNGTISNLPEEGATENGAKVGYDQELFTITPTAEK